MARMLLLATCLWVLLVSAVSAITAIHNKDQEELEYFPQFHVRPPTNWINDPNGPFQEVLLLPSSSSPLVAAKKHMGAASAAQYGNYHLWMQYNPHASIWGNMSWYHCSSTDLIHWKRLGVSLTNDNTYDAGGVFSGSVSVVEQRDKNQKKSTPIVVPAIFYTCVDKAMTERQCYALPSYKDNYTVADPQLLHWTKSSLNPVIAEGPLNDENTGAEFRDPTTMWREEKVNATSADDDNDALLIAFGVSLKGGFPSTTSDSTSKKQPFGGIALYRTNDDLRNFSYAGLLFNITGQLVPMFECPDFYRVDKYLRKPGQKAAKNVRGKQTKNQLYVTKVSFQGDFKDYWRIGTVDHHRMTNVNSRTAGTTDTAPLFTALPRRPPVGWPSSNNVSFPPSAWHSNGGVFNLTSFGAHANTVLTEDCTHVDYGKWYASKTFLDMSRQRRTLWGWIGEEDLDFASRGWAGSQSLPRAVHYDEALQLLKAEPIHDLVKLRRREIAFMSNVTASVVPLWQPNVSDHSQRRAARHFELDLNGTASYKALFTPASSASASNSILRVSFFGSSSSSTSDYRAPSLSIEPTPSLENQMMTGKCITKGDYLIVPFADTLLADAKATEKKAKYCAQVCLGDPRCTAWTATKENCHLKSAVMSKPTTAECIASGYAAAPTLALHRPSSSGSNYTVVGRLTQVRRANQGGDRFEFRLRLFVDNSVIEAFKDDGSERIATRIYSRCFSSEKSSSSFCGDVALMLGDGGVKVSDAKLWELDSIWK